MEPFISRNYLHISVDDVIEILKELEEQKYESVWDHPVLALFKDLNEQYGAVFSLYCFYLSNDGQWNLDQMPEKFKEEFGQASHWMRFGFHAYCYESRYGVLNDQLTSQDALAHYSLIIDSICRFAGPGGIDLVPRIHFYQGTREKIRAWKSARYGIRGLLTAEDARDEVYYLDEIQRKNLVKRRNCFDRDENLYLIKTNIRLEDEADPVLKLEARKRHAKEQGHIFCIFTHEDKLNLPTIKKKMVDCCEWANMNGYEFSFPMDLLPNRRSRQQGGLYANTSRNSEIPGSSTPS